MRDIFNLDSNKVVRGGIEVSSRGGISLVDNDRGIITKASIETKFAKDLLRTFGSRRKIFNIFSRKGIPEEVSLEEALVDFIHVRDKPYIYDAYDDEEPGKRPNTQGMMYLPWMFPYEVLVAKRLKKKKAIWWAAVVQFGVSLEYSVLKNVVQPDLLMFFIFLGWSNKYGEEMMCADMSRDKDKMMICWDERCFSKIHRGYEEVDYVPSIPIEAYSWEDMNVGHRYIPRSLKIG